MRLNELRDRALRIAVEHGFKDATIPEDMALIHSEVSEALEEYREGALPTTVWYEEKVPVYDAAGDRIWVDGKEATVAQVDRRNTLGSGKPCGIPSEMADIVIRVLHFCGKHGIDLEQAVIEKMAYNESRPFKHGKVI